MLSGKSRSLILLLVLLTAISLSGCGMFRTTYPSKSYPQSGKSYVVNGKRYYLLASADGYRERGDASWYGKTFHGRKTASGERYDMYKLSAAHKTLPLGTVVKVTHLTNNREIAVRINDRGPFVHGRIIDLSFAAAQKLGMIGSGTAPVEVVALGTPEERRIGNSIETVLVQPRSYTVGHFSVQVGAFRDRTNAESLAKSMKKKYGASFIQTFDRGDAVFYRVQVGDRATLKEAEKLQETLERDGFRDSFVVAR